MHLTPGKSFHKAVAMPRRLETLVIEKPWGRTDIPCAFGNFGERRIGEIWFAHPDGNESAILVKFLFTSERLSIQVHPGDAAAQAAGFRSGKDECWLVLDADAGAELGVGLIHETSREALREAALDGSIVDLVDWRPARKGDFIFNPAGTVHAIGGGLTIVEVQQNVDCTYRLYDYGRPRPLHLDAGLAVAALGPRSETTSGRVDDDANTLLVDGPRVRLLHLAGPAAAELLPAGTGDYTFVPLSDGCEAAGEPIRLGECVMLDRADTIALAPGARALLCWSA